MSCNKCRKKIETIDQKFCRHCGAELKITTEVIDSQDFIIEREATQVYTRFMLSLASASVVLALLSIIIGLVALFNITSSLYRQYTLSDLYIFEWFFKGYGYFIPEPDYVLDKDLQLASYLFGLVFLNFSIIGVILGIIAVPLRNYLKGIHSNVKLHRIGLFIILISFILNIIVGIIAGYLLYYPTYVFGLNSSLLKYNML